MKEVVYLHCVNQFLQGLIIATGFLSHNYIELQMKVIVFCFKMKTLHIISLNSCFVSIHVVVRFTHGYRDFVADNDYEFFIQIPGLFKRQRLKNVFLAWHVLRNSGFTNSFKTNKKTFAAEH